MADVDEEDAYEAHHAEQHHMLSDLWHGGGMRGRFRFVDSRLKGKRREYVGQAALATGALVVILSAQDLLTNAAIFAALASTAFVLFLMPHSITSTPRHVIGGHLVSAST